MLDTVQDGAPTWRAAVLARWVRAAVVVVLGVSVADWVGWATGTPELTRANEAFPHMPPWAALCLAALGVAILLQTGHQPRGRVVAGCALAMVVGVLAVVFLAEYATNMSFGIDQLWFPETVRAMQASYPPGRPTPWAAASILLLSAAVMLMRVDRTWGQAVWLPCLAAASIGSLLTGVGYLFSAMLLVGIPGGTSQAVTTAAAVFLLVASTLVACPDRNPLAWLLARPDRSTLARLGAVLAGLPILVGLLRMVMLASGVPDDVAWVLSVSASTLALSVATFYLSQREQGLLIEKESLASQRAAAEARYRILAENAVDIVVHIRGTVVHVRGTEIGWVSPSVETAFGELPQKWIGSDFISRVHSDDADLVVKALNRAVPGESVVERFRVRTAAGGYHWVECHSKPYVDSDGHTDGVITALRIIDRKVEVQRRLEQLARYDPLTGLANRGEAMSRLETALGDMRSAGPHLGLLFCDVDCFKDVNDTWGHSVGDLVLSTVANRICECVRQGDTVGRTGGDEMLVLLPGLHSLGEAAQIAEKIRRIAAEPIHDSGEVISVTLSIGATLAVGGESILDMTARADAAMYRAKRIGGNCVNCA